ncbi:uncharacterized protein LOC142803514 [Rhipicephalus microplus]|uniref:uncharacterized protein LOC142803514 n=1 Tax=Rhipicephalus microplus TaxID=6941 RepID=UPI003F6BE31D
MDKAAQRRERKAAAARARRQNPDVRAREAAAARRRRQDPAVREKEAAAARLRREQDLPNATQREAARKRAYRQANREARVREASAKRAKKEHEGADARFKRDFLDVSFGHSCGVCDRLWFSNSLVTISSIKNDQARGNAIAVLRREFPADDGGSSSGGDYNVCSSCKNSLVAGKVPLKSVSYGYTYPPKPDHLPPLNPVEERLIAPRLLFMSIRRLTHGSGQYRIKGQVVNVPINVPNTVQCLPRNVPDDVAIDVHLKCRLVCKPSYKKGLVKKRNMHEWLKHLEHSPLYKYLKIKIDSSRLANVQDDGDVDDDESECPAGGVAIYVRQTETAEDLRLPLTSQSQNGEYAAIKLFDSGIVLMTMYLAPNLSTGNIKTLIDTALRNYENKYKNGPFVLLGDFNVAIIDNNWLIQHMASRYALRRISFDHMKPTTIRGTCIDLVFANCPLQPIQEPLFLHFTDHKAVIMKGHRKPFIV